MKRVLTALVSATVALLLGGSALAQAYAPTGPAIAASSSVVATGGSVTLTVTGFPAGSTVRFTLNPGGISLGSATANANGTATLTVQIPSNVAPGAYQVLATGGGISAVLNLTITRPTLAAPPRPGHTAFTGADVAGLVTLALVLLGVGTGLVIVGRRRRAHSSF